MQSPAPNRVLHLLPATLPQGETSDLLAQCHRLHGDQFEVHIAGKLNARTCERLKDLGLIGHELPRFTEGFHPIQDLRFFLALSRLLHGQTFDLLHTYGAKASYLGRLVSRRCSYPLPVVTQDCLSQLWDPRISRWQRALHQSLHRRLRRSADFMITTSTTELLKGERCQVLASKHSQSVLPGFDYEDLDRASDTALFRQKQDIPSTSHTILLTAKSVKGLSSKWLSEAFQIVIKTHPKTRVLVTNEGAIPSRIKLLFTKSGLGKNVCYLAHHEDLPELIKSTTVVVAPSQRGKLDRLLIQAMLLGKPVVAPNSHSFPEVIHHGETGLLYDPGVAHQLGSHINYLLNHPTELYRLGVNARRFARPQFEINRTVHTLAAIYDRLLVSNHSSKPIPLHHANTEQQSRGFRQSKRAAKASA